jgi:hypothetical protein
MGELASLAYGSLKALLQIEELLLREVMVLRTLDPGFVSIPGDLWPVFQCFRPLGTCFALVLGARLEDIWTPDF